jgi:hypothetical protein
MHSKFWSIIWLTSACFGRVSWGFRTHGVKNYGSKPCETPNLPRLSSRRMWLLSGRSGTCAFGLSTITFNCWRSSTLSTWYRFQGGKSFECIQTLAFCSISNLFDPFTNKVFIIHPYTCFHTIYHRIGLQAMDDADCVQATHFPLAGCFRTDGLDLSALAGAAGRPPILRSVELTSCDGQVRFKDHYLPIISRFVYYLALTWRYDFLSVH